MLIDTFAPAWDAREIHRIQIAASRDAVYRALRTTDLHDSRVIRWLVALRALPRLLRRRNGVRRLQTVGLDTMLKGSFGLLAEDPGREIVIGITGRFWRPIDNILPFDKRDFEGAVAPGYARGIWNFSIEQDAAGVTTLSTETRVMCGDRASRTKFRAYWLIVRPFSGLIRTLILRAVRKHAMSAF